jgi:hypothetical protein
MQTAIRFGFIPDAQLGLIGQARTVEELVTSVTTREVAPGRYTFLDWSSDDRHGNGQVKGATIDSETVNSL